MDSLIAALRATGSLLAWLWTTRDQWRIVLLGLVLGVTLSNLYFLRRVDRYGCAPGQRAGASLPSVSVLVPARDEEQNIETCVLSLLSQDYPRFEVLVLDDDSSDGTPCILSRLQAAHPRLRVFKSKTLPEGWLGKHWACQQLASRSRGEFLLFTDADTRHHPRTLRDAVAAQQAQKADLLTGLPREETGSWAEVVVMPVIGWAAVSLLPIGLAHRLKSALLSLGIGQFMLFRRETFWAIGGFEAVRGDPVDDLALARRIKGLGFRWRFVDLTRRVECRMYRGLGSVADGLGKSVFPALRGRLWVLALLTLLLVWLYLGPIAALSGWLLGLPVAEGPPLSAGVAVGLALAGWTVVMWRTQQPLRRAFLYPLTVAFIIGIATRSAVMFWRGRATWKGRNLPGVSEASSRREEHGSEEEA